MLEIIPTCMGDVPGLGAADSVANRVKPVVLFAKVRSKHVGAALQDAVRKMGAQGERAEEEYQEALVVLRKSAEEAVPVLEHEFAGLPERDYLDRWAVVQLLAELS